MLHTPTKHGHSAVVTLLLETNGWSTRLASVGPDSVVAKSPAELPPCEAMLTMTVDGRILRSRIRLPQGMSPSIQVTPIEILERIA